METVQVLDSRVPFAGEDGRFPVASIKAGHRGDGYGEMRNGSRRTWETKGSSRSMAKEGGAKEEFEFCKEFGWDTVKTVVHTITRSLKAGGVHERFIFLPFREEQTNQKLLQFLKAVFPSKGKAVAAEEKIARVVGATDSLTLVQVLKYIWCRLPQDGVIGWDAYTVFCKEEEMRGYPKQAFLDIMPKCLSCPGHASVVYDFLDLVVAVSSNSKENRMSLKKLTRLCALWAFGNEGNGHNTFHEGLEMWLRGADAMFHMALSFVRSFAHGKLDSTAIPSTLKKALLKNEYPPAKYTSDLSATALTVPVVTLRTSTYSRKILSLLKRCCKHFSAASADDFVTREDYVVAKSFLGHSDVSQLGRMMTKESRRLLREMSTRHSTFQAGWPEESCLPTAGGQSDYVVWGRASVDDVFLWTWMSTLSHEQTLDKKKTFGRSFILEFEVDNLRKWIVIEEADIALGDSTSEAVPKPIQTRKPTAQYTRFHEASNLKGARPVLPLKPLPAEPEAPKKYVTPVNPSVAELKLNHGQPYFRGAPPQAQDGYGAKDTPVDPSSEMPSHANQAKGIPGHEVKQKEQKAEAEYLKDRYSTKAPAAEPNYKHATEEISHNMAPIPLTQKAAHRKSPSMQAQELYKTKMSEVEPATERPYRQSIPQQSCSSPVAQMEAALEKPSSPAVMQDETMTVRASSQGPPGPPPPPPPPFKSEQATMSVASLPELGTPSSVDRHSNPLPKVSQGHRKHSSLQEPMKLTPLLDSASYRKSSSLYEENNSIKEYTDGWFQSSILKELQDKDFFSNIKLESPKLLSPGGAPSDQYSAASKTDNKPKLSSERWENPYSSRVMAVTDLNNRMGNGKAASKSSRPQEFIDKQSMHSEQSQLNRFDCRNHVSSNASINYYQPPVNQLYPASELESHYVGRPTSEPPARFSMPKEGSLPIASYASSVGAQCGQSISVPDLQKTESGNRALRAHPKAEFSPSHSTKPSQSHSNKSSGRNSEYYSRHRTSYTSPSGSMNKATLSTSNDYNCTGPIYNAEMNGYSYAAPSMDNVSSTFDHNSSIQDEARHMRHRMSAQYSGRHPQPYEPYNPEQSPDQTYQQQTYMDRYGQPYYHMDPHPQQPSQMYHGMPPVQPQMRYYPQPGLPQFPPQSQQMYYPTPYHPQQMNYSPGYYPQAMHVPSQQGSMPLSQSPSSRSRNAKQYKNAPAATTFNLLYAPEAQPPNKLHGNHTAKQKGKQKLYKDIRSGNFGI